MSQMEPNQIRTRTRASEPVEIRDNRRLCFYAAIFNSETQVFDYVPTTRERKQFREVVRPGAFAESLSGTEDIIANIDHDDARTFAKRSDGLLLQEDKKGLFASVWLPDTKLGDEIIRDVNDEKIRGCSFRSKMIEGGDVWDGDLCQVITAPLIDVCVTGSPAYRQTEVKIRTEKLMQLIRRLRLLKLKSNQIDNTVGTLGGSCPK